MKTYERNVFGAWKVALAAVVMAAGLLGIAGNAKAATNYADPNAKQGTMPSANEVYEMMKANPYIRFYSGTPDPAYAQTSQGTAWTTVHPDNVTKNAQGVYVMANEATYAVKNYSDDSTGSVGTDSTGTRIEALDVGEHYYAKAVSGAIAVDWVPSYKPTGVCIHGSTNAASRYFEYFGIIGINAKICFKPYDAGWVAYCKDCGELLNGHLVFMSEEAAHSIGYVLSSDPENPLPDYLPRQFVYYCPYDGQSLEQSSIFDHTCTAFKSKNRYVVVYNANYPAEATKTYGSMTNSVHFYDNATEYEGKSVTPNETLNANNYECFGYVFKGWSLTPNGKAQVKDKGKWKELQDALKRTTPTFFTDPENNATDEDVYGENPSHPITLYAVWEKVISTVQIDGGSFNGNLGKYNGIAAGTYTDGKTKFTAGYDKNGRWNSLTIETGKLTAPAGYVVSFQTSSGATAASAITSTTAYQGWSKTSSGGNTILGTFNEVTGVYLYTSKTNGSWDRFTATWASNSIILPEPANVSGFSGWYTGKNGTGTFVGMGGDPYTPTGNVTLYAATANLVLNTTPDYTVNSSKGATDAAIKWSTSVSGYGYTFYQQRLSSPTATTTINSGTWTKLANATDTSKVGQTVTLSGTVTAPYTGTYKFVLTGAKGSNSAYMSGGNGGSVEVSFYLKKGQTVSLETIAGGSATAVSGTYVGANGGAGVALKIDGTVVAVAGGGGGGGYTANGGAGGTTSNVSSTYTKTTGVSGTGGGGGGGASTSYSKAGSVVFHVHNTTTTSNPGNLSVLGTCDVITGSVCGGSIQSTTNKCGATIVKGSGYSHYYAECPFCNTKNINPTGTGYLVECTNGHYHGWTGTLSCPSCGKLLNSSNNDSMLGQTCGRDSGTTYKCTVCGHDYGGSNPGSCTQDTRAKVIGCRFAAYSSGQQVAGNIESSTASTGGANWITSSASFPHSAAVMKVGTSTQASSTITMTYPTEVLSTDLTYNDIASNDVAAPNAFPAEVKGTVPSVLSSTTEIKVSGTLPRDVGTRYAYKAVATQLSNPSSTVNSEVGYETLTSGLAGYKYLLSTSSSVTAATVMSSGTDVKTTWFTNYWGTSQRSNSSNYYEAWIAKNGDMSYSFSIPFSKITNLDVKWYIHLVAYDVAGNTSAARSYTIYEPGVGNVVWPVTTKPLAISGDSVYAMPGASRTYYVRADGNARFNLTYSAYVTKALVDYQVNKATFQETAGGNNSVLVENQNPLKASVTVANTGNAAEGTPSLVRTGNLVVTRTDTCKTLNVSQDFSTTSEKKIEVYPVGVANAYEAYIKQTGISEIKSDYASDLANKLTLYGDASAPVIYASVNGGTKRNMTEVSLSNTAQSGVVLGSGGTYKTTITFTAEDPKIKNTSVAGSGVKEFSVTIVNTDAQLSQTYTSVGGVVTVVIEYDKSQGALAPTNILFAGAFHAEGTATDNVGNTKTYKSGDTNVLDVSGKVTRPLDAIDHRNAAGADPLTFRRGETGIITAYTYGYADYVTVTFTETELQPYNTAILFKYYGAGVPAAVSSFPNIEKINKILPSTENDVEFLIPLEFQSAVNPAEIHVTITAYKGSISYSWNATLKVDVEGKITDDIKTILIE